MRRLNDTCVPLGNRATAGGGRLPTVLIRLVAKQQFCVRFAFVCEGFHPEVFHFGNQPDKQVVNDAPNDCGAPRFRHSSESAAVPCQRLGRIRELPEHRSAWRRKDGRQGKRPQRRQKHFEAELLKPEANPAGGPRLCPVYASRKSFGVVIPGDSGSGPGCRQHSGLGGGLDLSI